MPRNGVPSPASGAILWRPARSLPIFLADFLPFTQFTKILTYDDYRNFQKVVRQAIKSCEGAGEEASDHFVEVTDMIIVGKGAKRPYTDYHLARQACYLVVVIFLRILGTCPRIAQRDGNLWQSSLNMCLFEGKEPMHFHQGGTYD